MEDLKVLDISNVFIASYFTDNRECTHTNAEHTLIYLCTGQLEITDKGKKTILHAGEYAFMRRDNRMTLQKHIVDGTPYRSVVLKFKRRFLQEFYQGLDKSTLPSQARRDRRSLMLLPAGRPDIKSLFESKLPYFDSQVQPTDELLKLKMIEGLYVLLNTDKNLYASLFDFTEPWKIDLLTYMNENYMCELSMEELARYTGRSLATFKRDFKKISELSPQRWLIRKRLEAAHDLITLGKTRVTEACYLVGFKNLSHFSRAYKDMYGYSPANSL